VCLSCLKVLSLKRYNITRLNIENSVFESCPIQLMSVEQMRGYAHPYSVRKKISEKQNEHDPKRVKLRH
jgi:hypothetical protein